MEKILISTRMNENNKAEIKLGDRVIVLDYDKVCSLMNNLTRVRQEIVAAAAAWSVIDLGARTHISVRGENKTLCGRLFEDWRYAYIAIYPDATCKHCNRIYAALPEAEEEDSGDDPQP